MITRRLILFALGALASGLVASPATTVAASESSDNYIVVYDSSSHVNKDAVRGRGADIKGDLSQAGVLAVETAQPEALQTLPGVVGVAIDRMRLQVPDVQLTSAEVETSPLPTGCASTEKSCPLQWDLARLHVPQAWRTTEGSSTVKVAILDSGVTSTHPEVVGSANYDKAESKSFVQPNLVCQFDTPATSSSKEDFIGHGTWTATHIAGVNGPQMTGIAPNATFVNLRVAGVCGYAADSWIMSAMLYGNQIGAQVENISLGGYLCGHGIVKGSSSCGTTAQVGTDPILWRAYRQVVNHVLAHGTLVVASAGNEHVQLDSSGRVVSHGAWKDGLNPHLDLFGTTEAPGGVPGVLAVASTNRITAQGTTFDLTFGQYGAGRKDQLASYSNYGRRIDVSAPGGARNMNVPFTDCKTPSCFRLMPSMGATDNPGVFGAWGRPIPALSCRISCYLNVAGTSAAVPQVAGVAVLALSANPNLSPRELANLLRRSVSEFGDLNATPALEDDPSKSTYLFGMDYDGPAVSNHLMGKGVIDAARAVEIASEEQ